MLRHSLVLAALWATSLISANGCQSCSSCHDYDPPVANCNYGPQCGCHGGSSNCSGCGCNHGSGSSGPYMSEGYTQEGQQVEAAPEGEMIPATPR
jgi:hypothetical protein